MYIKNIIIIYDYCPHLLTQNKQTKMKIMRMLALRNVAKSEVYLQEYKLSPTRDLVLLKRIISTMLEKKKRWTNVTSPWRRIVWKGVGSTVVMGLFEVNYMYDPLFTKKKKTQRTKSAYEMKEVGSCSPNSEALEDCALLIDVGFIGQKLTWYKPTTMGLEQLLPNGSDFFFISIVTW